MDNTKVPRPLIYRERRSLEEFIDKSAMNETLVDNMSNVYYMKENFRERALKCMNTAYYICTLILSEKHPEWSFDTYCNLAFCGDKKSKVNQAVTLSLVSLYINELCEEQRKKLQKLKTKLDDFMNSVLHFISSGDPFIDNCYYADILIMIKRNLSFYYIDENEFAFRVIDKEAVREVMFETSFSWVLDYFKESLVREFVDYYGNTEEEKHNVVYIFRQAAIDFYSPGSGKYEEVDLLLNKIDHEILLKYNNEADHPLSESEIADVDSDDSARFQAQIEEMKMALSQKDQLLEEAQNANNQQDSRIKDLEAKNADLTNQLEQRDDKIKNLETDLQEANANLPEYDSAVSESVNYRYVLGKGKHIQLSDRERNIIEYTIHCVAANKTSLNANMKRLIGVEKTVGAHFNDSKKEASRPLTNEEKNNIKLVLDKEDIDYGDLLAEHF